MSVKLSGGKARNPVKVAKNRDLRDEQFFASVPKHSTPRYFDKHPTLMDGTTSHNGVVVTTANLAKR